MTEDHDSSGPPDPPDPTPSSTSPEGVHGYRALLSKGEDAVDPATWAGSVPEARGIAPRVRIGRSRWFNLLWLLPNQAWATEIERRWPGSLRLFAPSQTTAAGAQLGSRRFKTDDRDCASMVWLPRRMRSPPLRAPRRNVANVRGRLGHHLPHCETRTQ